jgi:hypothetical protein
MEVLYSGRCGACRLYYIAAHASLEDGKLRVIEGPNKSDIRTDGRFMHAADYQRSGVICIFSDKKDKFPETYSTMPEACQNRKVLFEPD